MGGSTASRPAQVPAHPPRLLQGALSRRALALGSASQLPPREERIAGPCHPWRLTRRASLPPGRRRGHWAAPSYQVFGDADGLQREQQDRTGLGTHRRQALASQAELSAPLGLRAPQARAEGPLGAWGPRKGRSQARTAPPAGTWGTGRESKASNTFYFHFVLETLKEKNPKTFKRCTECVRGKPLSPSPRGGYPPPPFSKS